MHVCDCAIGRLSFNNGALVQDSFNELVTTSAQTLSYQIQSTTCFVPFYLLGIVSMV